MKICYALLLGMISLTTWAQTPLASRYAAAVERYYAALEHNRPDSALYYLGEALEIWPQSPTNYLLYGLQADLLLQRKDTVPALSALSKGLLLRPNEASLLLKRAELLLLQHKYTAALADYDNLLLQSPNHEPALYNRALVKLALGLLEGAQADLESIVKHNDKAYQPRLMIAEVLLRKGADDKAEKVYNYLVNTYPSIPEAYRRRAALYLQQKRKALAAADVYKIFELGKNIGYRDYLLRGRLALLEGDKVTAARDFRMAQSLGAPAAELKAMEQQL